MQDLEIRFIDDEIGRGVFATREFNSEEIIESCPLIVLTYRECQDIDKTKLYDYYFTLPDGNIAIALGYGSLYNYSETPNSDYYYRDNEIIFRAKKRISAGEEITTDYHCEKDRLWFVAR